MSNAGNDVTSPDRDAASAVISRWVALWNGDYAIAEELISADNRVHAAMFDGGDGSAIHGAPGMVAFVQDMRGLMSDLDFSVEVGPIVDGAHVVIRWVATGHYGGGIPTAGAAVGTEVTFRGTDILRVLDDRVVEYWLNADTMDLMTQLQVGAG